MEEIPQIRPVADDVVAREIRKRSLSVGHRNKILDSEPMSSSAWKRGYREEMGCMVSLSKFGSIDNQTTANTMAYEVLEVGFGLRGKGKKKRWACSEVYQRGPSWILLINRYGAVMSCSTILLAGEAGRDSRDQVEEEL